MTVSELIKYLEQQPKDRPVGFVGHFGEFIPLKHWMLTGKRVVEQPAGEIVVEITAPDLGEEPD